MLRYITLTWHTEMEYVMNCMFNAHYIAFTVVRLNQTYMSMSTLNLTSWPPNVVLPHAQADLEARRFMTSHPEPQVLR